jgi:hypothetical protein
MKISPVHVFEDYILFIILYVPIIHKGNSEISKIFKEILRDSSNYPQKSALFLVNYLGIRLACTLDVLETAIANIPLFERECLISASAKTTFVLHVM